MKKLFVILIAALLSFGAAAQQVAANPTTAMGAFAATSSLVKAYRGDYMAPRPSYRAFDLVITRTEGDGIQGSVRFWNPIRACGAEASVTGTDVDGVIDLSSHSDKQGCERHFKLKRAAGGVLIGEALTAFGYTQVMLVPMEQ